MRIKAFTIWQERHGAHRYKVLLTDRDMDEVIAVRLDVECSWAGSKDEFVSQFISITI